MTTKQFTIPALALFSCAVTAADKPLFPEYATIPLGHRFPKYGTLTTDHCGNLLVNGKKRFLIGTQVGLQRISADLMPSIGYPPEFRWLYEEPLTYENAQRIGLDAVYIFTPDWWIQERIPSFKPEMMNNRNNRKMIRQILESGLPILVDYTCFPWRHGRLIRPEYRRNFPPEIFNEFHTGNGNHWVPYNIFHREARDLYRHYWQAGAKLMKQYKANTFIYELFNEPAYNDPSAYNRKLFSGYLERKYRTPEKMNRRWRTSYRSFEEASMVPNFSRVPPLSVDWGKFLEEGFTELAKLGCRSIREIDPGAKFSFQILGFNNYRNVSASNVNIWEISKFMDVISTSTTGGLYIESAQSAPPPVSLESPSNPTSISEGILERHFYRNCARGKAIINPEAYSSNNPDVLRWKIWIDMLRGSSTISLFDWSKRGWEYEFDLKKAQENAEKFTYSMLNPFAVPTQILAEIRKIRREISQYGEFFIPRELRPKAEIALLISYPTERYTAASGKIFKNELLHYAAALEFSHYSIDVLMEEQLADGVPAPYRAVIAVGVENTLPETNSALKRFAGNGGVVIGARGLLDSDEYGNQVRNPLFSGLKLLPLKQPQIAELKLRMPLRKGLEGNIQARLDFEIHPDESWRVLGSINSQPQILRKKNVYFIGPFLQEYAIAGVLGSILEAQRILPELNLYRVPAGDMAVNIEAHCAEKDGLRMVFLQNFDAYPKRTEMELTDGISAVTLPGRKRLPLNNGRARFLLGACGGEILALGKLAAIEQKFGKTMEETLESLDRQFNALEKIHKKEREAARSAETFSPDPAATYPLDLRKFCNSSFIDDRSGDGEGGWTDQGRENSLDGVPWGLQVLKGVPCEIIRPDSNDDKSCIILNSTSSRRVLPKEVKGIPVNEKVLNLYFFHTGAFGKSEQKIMTYRINYADGSTLDIPVRNGSEIEDWWTMLTRARKMSRFIAWKNMQGRGFYVWQWTNPHPERLIASLDIRSENAAPIPIVIGITCEKYAGEKTIPLTEIQCRAFGKCRVEKDNGIFRIRISSETGGWAGILLEAPGIDWRDLPSDTQIRFKVNGAFDSFGNRRGGQNIQLKLDRRFKLPSVDSDPETFETVSVPLRELLSPEKKGEHLLLQFVGSGKDAGVEVRDFELEYRSEP